MNPVIQNISTHPAFAPVRFSGAFALKAGILPYDRGASGEVRFLVAAPKPVKNPDDTVPFAMARGSRRMRAAGENWVDIRSNAEMEAAISQAAEMEAAPITALAEGEEELGLPASAVRVLYDCGVLAYKDYGIHCFLAQVGEGAKLLPARDSAATRWLSLQEVQEMATGGAFNPRYLPLLEAMAAAVKPF